MNGLFLAIQFGSDVDLDRFSQWKGSGSKGAALDVPKILIWLFIISSLSISAQYAPFENNRLCSYFQALQNSTLSPLRDKQRRGVENERNTTQALCLEQSGHRRDIFII